MKSIEKAIDIVIMLIMFMITIKFIVIPVRDKVINAADAVSQTMEKWKGDDKYEDTDTRTNFFDEFGTTEQRNITNGVSVEQEFTELKKIFR